MLRILVSVEIYLIAIRHRPISLATIMSKLFESVILLKCEMFLDTCPNQFGFKKKHSTDRSIYVLNEMYKYFKSRSTSVFVTFLNASKAYNKIDQKTADQ